MPTFRRQTLRHSLGLDYVRDLTIGTLSTGVAQGLSAQFMDTRQADAALSGADLYVRAWLKHSNNVYRVASFNTASGAWVTAVTMHSASLSGNGVEVHSRLSPAEKDRAIDDAVKRLRVQREVGLPSVDGAYFYTLDGCASPNTLIDVLDVYAYADPTHSLNREKRTFDHWRRVDTPTGSEVRVYPALPASYQLVLDAILAPTLGAADDATINLPDDRWILAGAALKCFDMLTRDAPPQEVSMYRQQRNEMAREYTRLSARFQSPVYRRIQFDDPVA